MQLKTSQERGLAMVTKSCYNRVSYLLVLASLAAVLMISLLLVTASQSSAQNSYSGTVTRMPYVDPVTSKTEMTSTSVYTAFLPLAFHNYYAPSWRAYGMQDTVVRTIADNPATADVLYAGVYGQGIYRTIDAGRTWEQMNHGLRPNPTVRQIAADPKHFGNVYATFTSYPRFYYSSDSGLTWQSGGSVSLYPCALAVHPAIMSRMFLSVCTSVVDIWAGGQLYKSDNNGLSWTEVYTGHVAARTIAVAPKKPCLVYAAGLKLLRSWDGGDTWGDITSSLPAAPFWSIVAHPTNPLVAYAISSIGTFKTSDGGDTWVTWGVILPPNGIGRLLISANTPSIQYASSACAGIYTSTDEGRHWQSRNSGLGNLCVQDMILSQSSTRLYAATEDGIWMLNLTMEGTP